MTSRSRALLKKWVLKRHRSLIKITTIEEHGRLIDKRRGDALANLTLRLLNAVLNYSRRKHKDEKGHPILVSNPVDAMSRDRAWSRIQKRQNYIPREKLSAFYEALKDEHVRCSAGRVTHGVAQRGSLRGSNGER